MKNRYIVIALLLILFDYSYSQSIFDLRCDFYSDYILDTTFQKENKWKFLPIKNDSLLLKEQIDVSKSEKMYTKKEYEKMIKKTIENLSNDIGIYYVEELSRGISYNNNFQDFIIFYSITSHIDLSYIRFMYNNFSKNKNYIYTISYKATIPRNSFNEKWNLSIPHFIEKSKKNKFLINCK